MRIGFRCPFENLDGLTFEFLARSWKCISWLCDLHHGVVYESVVILCGMFEWCLAPILFSLVVWRTLRCFELWFACL